MLDTPGFLPGLLVLLGCKVNLTMYYTPYYVVKNLTLVSRRVFLS